MTTMSARSGVSGLRCSLGIQVLEFARFDTALSDEVIDLALLEPDDAPESIRRKLTLVDEPVQRARCQTERGRRFFGRKPVAVCLCHTNQHNTISTPLSISRPFVPFRSGRDRCGATP